MYYIYKMAFVTNYTFDNMSRIGNDVCNQDQNAIQNINASNYLLQNYFAKDCSMKQPIDLATTQPGINYNGPSSVGSGGCVVDASSKLLIGSIQTHPRCRIDLFQRPFATVPFLGRGSVDPILEAQIQQGDANTNKRSVNNLSEKSYLKYQNSILLPNIQSRLTNPAYCVESVASEGWIRGGVPSRELTRDREYYNNQKKQ
uniref:Uncharacterized protein n=1 Tax=viral metagenome TaxID=1070528 RepID=A0A6C0HWY0_9ZZZZ